MASCDAASNIWLALGRGVKRSKRRAQECLRQAAENGHVGACIKLASNMYVDHAYAREVGHVGEAAAVTSSAGDMEGHDVPHDVLTSIIHWLLQEEGFGPADLTPCLDQLRKRALVGGTYCRNEGCEVRGQLKDFKVCPQCKTARYCGDACQRQDWNAGGHKSTCGTSAYKVSARAQ